MDWMPGMQSFYSLISQIQGAAVVPSFHRLQPQPEMVAQVMAAVHQPGEPARNPA
jgi:hypothetical protein